MEPPDGAVHAPRARFSIGAPAAGRLVRADDPPLGYAPVAMRFLSLPTRHVTIRQVLVLAAAGILGCPSGYATGTGGAGGDIADDGSPVPDVPCATDDDCASGKICEDTTCITGDRDNDATSATGLFWETEVQGEINPAGDVDWYRLTAEGGEFVRIEVSTEEDDNSLDSVVSVYTAAGKRVAWEDEHPAGNATNYDSVCFAYLPDAGDYFVRVEDRSTFYGEGSGGGSDSYYTILAKQVGPVDEPDTIESPGYAVEAIPSNINNIPIVLGEVGDRDYITVDYEASGLVTWIHGMTNNESSTLSPVFSLYDGQGARVATKADPVYDEKLWVYATEGTRYVLEVADRADDGGDNAWTVAFVQVADTDGTGVIEVEPNDSPDDPTALDQGELDSDDGQVWLGFGNGHVDPAEDVDAWAIAAPWANAYLSVKLLAEDVGSLLQGEIEILDGDGQVLAAEQFSPGQDLKIENARGDVEGIYYVQVRGIGTTPGGEGSYYRVLFYVTDFSVALN
jgi:hypothetical protein